MIYDCQFHYNNKRLIFNMHFHEIVSRLNMELENFRPCIVLLDYLQVINESHSQCNKASGKRISSNPQEGKKCFLTESKNIYEMEIDMIWGSQGMKQATEQDPCRMFCKLSE